MRLLIPGMGVVTIALLLVQNTAFAGVVAPGNPQPQSITPSQARLSLTSSDVAPEVIASPAIGRDAEPFWYPGASSSNLDAVTLNSVPLNSVGPTDMGPIANTQQHPLIPLPSAALTALAGLLSLGAAKVIRNFRRLIT